MDDKESSVAKKETPSLFRDKILQNATAADAAVVIVQQKLLKLRECKLILCTSLKRQIEDVRRSLDPVYEFLTNLPEGSKKREWKSSLLEAVYQMEDAIDVFRYKIALEDPANANQTIKICRPNMFLILWANHLLWRRLQEFKRRIKSSKDVEHIPDKPRGSGSDKAKAPQRHDRTEWDKLFSLDADGNNMAARKENMEKLKEQIAPGAKDDRITVIVGEQGFGKTFLARKIFTQLRDHFDCCAWVSFSRKVGSDEVFRSLLEQVSEDVVQQQHMPLDELLCQALYGKSYLIVLDDVADSDLLWAVYYALPDSYSGGRLLITTQHKFIANMLYVKHIEIKELEEREIKDLFIRKLQFVGRSWSSDGSEQNNDVMDAFIERCRGSPLILSLLSGLIAKSPVSVPIKDVINKIPDTDDLDRLFAHCYNKLHPELKPCLLYMALFPKGHPIPVRRLLRLWLSEGLLVMPPEAKMEPEDLGLDYLKELVIRNLIEVVNWKEDGSPTRVRAVSCLHDSICFGAIGTELLYINTRKEKEEVHHQQEQATTRLRWLAEHWNIEEELVPSRRVARINYLRSFLSFNTREGMLTQDIGYFLETVSGKGFNLLSVLDLEAVYKPNLDNVLGKLVLLKHLGLRSTALGSLPKSVADLPYLETLDLKHTNITELPKSFWKKSRNLRHLYLNNYCHIDKSILSSSFATSTETLANLFTFSGAVVDSIQVDKPAGTMEGLSNIKKLTKLGIMFRKNSDQDAIGKWISDLTNLQSLKLGIIDSGGPSSLPEELSLSQHQSLSKLYLLGKFNEFWKFLIPHNLVTLTLCGSCMSDDHIVQLGNLTKLKVLNLRGNSFSGNNLKIPDNLLKSLLVLRLWKLKMIVQLELKNNLPQIQTIELRDCPKMKKINHIEKVGSGRTVLLQLTNMSGSFVEEMKHQVNELNEQEEGKYPITVKVKTTEDTSNPTSDEESANSPGHLD